MYIELLQNKKVYLAPYNKITINFLKEIKNNV